MCFKLYVYTTMKICISLSLIKHPVCEERASKLCLVHLPHRPTFAGHDGHNGQTHTHHARARTDTLEKVNVK